MKTEGRDMTQLKIVSLSFAVTMFALFGLYWHTIFAGDVSYPADYRKWVHVKTTIVGPQSPFFKTGGGIHHIYANSKAVEGYETGKFPDGAILVFDLLDTKEADGLTLEGARQRIDVMVKDSQRFSATGGWGYERFLGDSATDRPLTEEHRALCFSCHEQRKTHDCVFSEYRK
jgi:Cytochrome P460